VDVAARDAGQGEHVRQHGVADGGDADVRPAGRLVQGQPGFGGRGGIGLLVGVGVAVRFGMRFDVGVESERRGDRGGAAGAYKAVGLAEQLPLLEPFEEAAGCGRGSGGRSRTEALCDRRPPAQTQSGWIHQ
jgi:hypothetical protein